MSEWAKERLGNLISIKGGYSYKGEHIGHGTSLLLGMGCVSFNETFLPSGARLYAGDVPDSFLAKPGDIVLATRQQSDNSPILGAPAIVPDNLKDKKVIIGTNLYRIENKSHINNQFLFWLLKTVDYKNHIDSCSKGSTVKMITKDAVESYEFLCPSDKERKQISDILWNITNKIDLLHRQNATLENMAETLFRQWFVEFSENKGEKTYSSELGEIPISIKIDQIKNLSHILESGKRPKGGVGSLTTGVPSIGAESIKGLGNFDYSKTKFVSEQFAGSMSKGFVNGYELLIYKDGGTPGHFIPRYSIFGAGFPFDKMVINEHVFKLDFGSKAYNFFMYYFFQTEITESILVANGAKAAIPGINQEDIRNLWVITPDNSLIESFGEITLPYLEKVLSNCKQIRTLTALRDTLLPKLMSGEVRVSL